MISINIIASIVGITIAYCIMGFLVYTAFREETEVVLAILAGAFWPILWAFAAIAFPPYFLFDIMLEKRRSGK